MIDLPVFDALALSLHHSPGVHAILVGSGLSRAAGIPTGWEITLDLVRQLAALDGATEQDDWAQGIAPNTARAQLLGSSSRPRLDDLRAAKNSPKLYQPAVRARTFANRPEPTTRSRNWRRRT